MEEKVRKTQRRVSALVAGVAIMALITGCAGSADSKSADGKKDGVITYRSWSPVDQTTKDMIKVTEAANKDIKIESEIFNYPEYLVDLSTRASSNSMPDIVGLQPGALTQQYRDKLMPLQDCAEKAWGKDWKEKFHPIGIEQARMGNPEGDENFYSLPLLVQTVNMWGNKQIMEKEGLSIPKTWDDLKAIAEKMKGKDKAGFMLPAKDGWLRNVVFLQIANNIEPGLAYKAEDGSDAWTNPRLVEALSYWQKLFKEKIVQDGAMSLDAYPSGANQFEAGNAAMIPLGAWWIQQSDPAKKDIAPLSKGMEGYEPFPFPTIPGGADTAQFVGGIDVALGISKDTKNPEKACKVVTDWISGKGAQTLTNTFNDIPAFKGINPEKFTSDHQKELWDTFTQQWLPQVKFSRYLKSPKMDQLLSDQLAALATGDTTPEKAAKALQKKQEEVNKKK